jgi:hypothetical protein
LASFSEFVLDVMNKLPGIKGIRTSISLEAVKAAAPLPLGTARQTRSKRVAIP